MWRTTHALAGSVLWTDLEAVPSLMIKSIKLCFLPTIHAFLFFLKFCAILCKRQRGDNIANEKSVSLTSFKLYFEKVHWETFSFSFT